MGIIYAALNRVNGKRYVGETRQSLKLRKQQHLRVWRQGCKYVSLLYCALSKYGVDSFDWVILEDNVDNHLLKEREKYHINIKGEYNINKTGWTIEYHPDKNKILEKRKKVYSQELIDQIINDYNKNKLFGRDILKKYHIGEKAFTKILKDNNIDKNVINWSEVNQLTKEEEIEIINYYVVDNKDTHEVAQLTHHTPSTISRVLKRNNIPINHKHRVKKIKQKAIKVYRCTPEKLKSLQLAAKIRRQNGSLAGINNPKWQGYWVTPRGKFTFIKEATKAMNMSGQLLSALCKDNIPITQNQIWTIKYFKDLKIAPGAFPKDIGFNFEYKNK